MTTIVLTPTHMASDHCFITNTLPHTTKVDITQPKIFVSPDETMIVGISGEFDPEDIANPKSWRILSMAMDFLSMAQITGLLVSDQIEIPETLAKTLDSVIDSNNLVFMVSKTHRFTIKTKEKKRWAKRLGDYAGIGTGGAFASGMLIAGTPITKIWKALHQIDCLSSEEHTIIPLSKLKVIKEKQARISELLKQENLL